MVCNLVSMKYRVCAMPVQTVAAWLVKWCCWWRTVLPGTWFNLNRLRILPTKPGSSNLYPDLWFTDSFNIWPQAIPSMAQTNRAICEERLPLSRVRLIAMLQGMTLQFTALCSSWIPWCWSLRIHSRSERNLGTYQQLAWSETGN